MPYNPSFLFSGSLCLWGPSVFPVLIRHYLPLVSSNTSGIPPSLSKPFGAYHHHQLFESPCGFRYGILFNLCLSRRESNPVPPLWLSPVLTFGLSSLIYFKICPPHHLPLGVANISYFVDPISMDNISAFVKYFHKSAFT